MAPQPPAADRIDRQLQSVIDAWPHLAADVRKMIAGVAVMSAKRK